MIVLVVACTALFFTIVFAVYTHRCHREIERRQALTSSDPVRHNPPHTPGQATPKTRTGADRSVTERNAQD